MCVCVRLQAFIGKVYGLLVVQIAVTLLISVLMMQVGGYNFYVWSLTEGAWTRMASLFAVIGNWTRKMPPCTMPLCTRTSQHHEI